jgi:hypothetical protein
VVFLPHFPLQHCHPEAQPNDLLSPIKQQILRYAQEDKGMMVSDLEAES